MINFDEMRKLVDQLNYYTKLYDEGHPEIDDQTWDKMYFLLSEMEKKTGIVLANSPTAKIDYQVVNSLTKKEHNHPMLSLDKTKSINDVITFANQHDLIAMAKMDGLTCSIMYKNGKLVSAETRGNGIVGEDITHNIKFVKGVPLELPIDNELIVDGEIICTYEDFEEFSAEYKNPRNFASGSIRLLDSRVSAQRKLTFVAWDCIKGIDNNSLMIKLIRLDQLGFIIVPLLFLPTSIVSEDKISHIIVLIKENAKEFGYPIDGLVFKYDDCAYYQSLGATEHHFRGGLAYKFYDEEYETILRDIEWSMGKTGQLTPVAIFDPVDDGESIVTRASLHNLNIMERILGDKPFVGQRIWVVKQNMIIPQVSRADKTDNEKTKEYLYLPDICPICGHQTIRINDFLYCTNDECEGQLLNHIAHFISKKGLDIRGLSKATIEKLIDWTWVSSLKDIFNLDQYRHDWLMMPGFGEKSVDNILAAIEASKSCELWQFIAGLSIPLIGVTNAKTMARKEFDWHNIREDIAGGYDFTKWDKFGPEMNASLHHFNYDEADDLANNVLKLKNSLWVDPNEKHEDVQLALKDKTFVITGSLNHYKNRETLQQDIEAHGGKVQKSISSATKYLVSNDKNSTSSKTAKAKSLNIPIISEEELIAMF